MFATTRIGRPTSCSSSRTLATTHAPRHGSSIPVRRQTASTAASPPPKVSASLSSASTAETLTRLWLGSRQIAAVQAHRDQVPEAFRGQVTLADQQKAADYTAARVRLGRWVSVVEALLKLALTLGGGLAAVDAVWRRTGIDEPWRGACVVASVLLLLQLVGLPFSLWRTFRIEARFGFNRVSPRLYAVDLIKQLALTVLLGGPLLLATLGLMERAGARWWLWVWLIWLAGRWC